MEDIEYEQSGKNLTIRLPGPEACHAQMQEIVADCCDKMRYDSAQNFVFDLEAVEFLASACIGSFVELLREVEPMRGKVALANCAENVAFVFKVTKLDDIFAMFDDIDEALQTLK